MNEMIDIIQKDASSRMEKSVAALKNELLKIRTGRANTSLLDHVLVPYYGSDVPVNQVANINVLDPRTLGVTAFEKGMVSVVEKAIRDSDLGLNPTNVGDLVRVPLPPMTEDRRRDLIKIVRNEVESTRVAIRNIRRDANKDFKDADLSKDETHDGEGLIQNLTNKFIAQVDEILTNKETELMDF
jgi:ribosome recycling factor